MILGTDERTPISADVPALYLYAPAVQIITVFSDGTMAQGSGTIVGPNDVITAAHVLYDDAHGGYAVGIEVTPLRLGEIKPFGVVYGIESVVSEGWIFSGNYEEDYGHITLSRPIGYQSGWIETDAVSPYAMNGRSLSSYGYPGDLDDGNHLYKIGGSVDSTYRNILRFDDDMDAMGGQSGSGVFLNSGGENRLIGVISYESIGPDYNGVCAFDESVAPRIEAWIEENDTDLTPPLEALMSIRSSVEYAELMCYALLGRGAERAEREAVMAMIDNSPDLLSVYEAAMESVQYRTSAVSTMEHRAFLTYLLDNVLEIRLDEQTQGEYLQMLQSGELSRAEAFALCVESPRMGELHRLDLYEIWHREYDDFEIEAIDNDESSTLIGGNGDSALWGEGGNDILIGGAGDDYLYGGADDDELYGGEGGDFFAWDRGGGVDTVYDFSPSEDTIRLRSDFDWSWQEDTEGNLIVYVSEYEGIVLSGIVPELSGTIAIV